MKGRLINYMLISRVSCEYPATGFGRWGCGGWLEDRVEGHSRGNCVGWETALGLNWQCIPDGNARTPEPVVFWPALQAAIRIYTVFPFGSDQRIFPLGFKIKNPIYLDQINRAVRTFHRQSPNNSVHRLHNWSFVYATHELSFKAMNRPRGTMRCRF